MPGEGSVFWISLPLDPGCPADASGTTAQEGAPQNTRLPAVAKSILIVEDNEINRVVLREMLEAENHIVTEAVNGREGVEKAATTAFDMILMDISMPVMDGMIATQQIRAGNGPSSRSPIIAVTAHALASEIADFERVGIDGYVSKPINRKDLRVIIGTGVAPKLPSASRRGTPINADHLAALRTDIGAELVHDIISRFLEEGEAAVNALIASDKGDAAEVARIAHQLAGSAGLVGAASLHAHLSSLETAAKTGADCHAIEKAVAVSREIWQETRAVLQEDWVT